MNQNVSADTNLRELALTIARNEVGANVPLSEVLANECLSADEYEKIAKNPVFAQYLKQIKAELVENGFSFASKCRVLAEDLLANAYRMAKDDDTPAAVRLRALENLVDWGDLKPKTAFSGANGPGYSIVINLPGVGAGASATQVTIDAAVTSATPPAPVIELPGAPPAELIPQFLSAPDLPLMLDPVDTATEDYYAAEAGA